MTATGRTGKPPRPVEGRYVALLRGVNVGGKNKLPMADLAAIFNGLGCSEVRTYIQSGNVVFTAKPVLARTIAGRVEKVLQDRLGITSPVILRSAAEMESIVADHPFAAAKTEEKLLAVAFLAHKPGKKDVATLDPERSPGDVFRLRGREIYLHTPNGAARSKLTNAYFDRVLKTTCTVRNWRTTKKLAEMLRAVEVP